MGEENAENAPREGTARNLQARVFRRCLGPGHTDDCPGRGTHCPTQHERFLSCCFQLS